MGFTSSSRSLFLQILTVFVATTQRSAASPAIATWWTERGPQLAVQNLTTLAIQYSACNSNGTPIYPVDQPFVLPTLTGYDPRNGTALTGVGWWDGNLKTTAASIWYQSDHGEIIQGLYQCDWSTGRFSSQSMRRISDDSPSVSNNTGLASIVLSSTAGYRVYFHDQDHAVNEIGYNPGTNKWGYREMISPERPVSNAIHAAFSGKTNISVVVPRDSENIEVSRYNSDTTWHLSSFPRPLAGNNITNTNSNADTISLNTTSAINFTLPFYGTPKGIGITIDSAFTRTVWYIGTDRNLYAAANIRFVWGLISNVSTLFWPQADEPNAPLGVTSDFASSQIRIYYFVNRTLTEIKFDKDGTWKQAHPVPAFNATADLAPPPGNSSSSGPSASSNPDPGLSSGAKAGIGVGVTLGVLAVAGVLGALFFFRRRAARASQHHPDAPEMENTALSPDTHPAAAAYDAHGNPIVYDPRYATPGSEVYGGSPPPGYVWEQKGAQQQGQGQVPQQLEGSEVPQELEGPRVMYELPDQGYSHELVGSGVAPKTEGGK